MPNNDHTQDLYNPPGTNTNDWDEMRFGDIDTSDLFWLRNDTTNGEINHCHRKLDESSAQNTQTRQVINIQSNTQVFQKI